MEKTAVKTVERKFNYNGMVIPDPNPKAPVDLVVKALCATYPEFAGAKIEPPEITTGEHGSRIETYNVKVAAGVKG
jgi:PRTRC genetic system protein C